MADTSKFELLPVGESAGIPDEAVDLLDEAIDLEGGTTRVLPGGRLVTITLSSGRKQRVQVLGIAGMPTGGPGLLLATPCAPARADRYGAMLRLNATLHLGAVELRTLGDTDLFVLSASVAVADLTVEKLRRAMRAIAERGDRLEETLTGGDVR